MQLCLTRQIIQRRQAAPPLVTGSYHHRWAGQQLLYCMHTCQAKLYGDDDSARLPGSAYHAGMRVSERMVHPRYGSLFAGRAFEVRKQGNRGTPNGLEVAGHSLLRPVV
jgi:hypothetical protein